VARAIDSTDGVRAIRRVADSSDRAPAATLPHPDRVRNGQAPRSDLRQWHPAGSTLPIVFAHTRYVYDSYRDYRRLVEISGFPTCYLDECEWDNPEVAYVTTPPNGEFPYDRALSRKCKLALWDLERPDSEGTRNVAESLNKFDGRVDAIWVSDRHYASLDSRYTFVPMGSSRKLPLGQPRERIYDFCHESYVYGRRDAPFAALRRRHREGQAGRFGVERDELLHSSRLMVNVHQTPCAVGEPLRFALAAAYGLPLVSETLRDPYPMTPGEHFEMADIEDVPDAASRALQRGDLQDLGSRLQSLLCDELPFEACVKGAVSRL